MSKTHFIVCRTWTTGQSVSAQRQQSTQSNTKQQLCSVFPTSVWLRVKGQNGIWLCRFLSVRSQQQQSAPPGDVQWIVHSLHQIVLELHTWIQSSNRKNIPQLRFCPRIKSPGSNALQSSLTGCDHRSLGSLALRLCAKVPQIHVHKGVRCGGAGRQSG